MRKVLFKFDIDNKKYRIDSYISFKELSLSRSKIKKLILSNNLKINKVIVNDPSYILKLGDTCFKHSSQKRVFFLCLQK